MPSLYFKPVEQADVKHVNDLRNMCRNSLHDSRAYSEDECLDWIVSIQKNQKSERIGVWLVESIYSKLLDSEYIGTIRVDNIDYINGTCSIGVDINPKFRKRGYATESYKYIFEELFFNRRIRLVWLEVLSTNVAACRLYEKLGFNLDGILRHRLFRNNKTVDVLAMSLTKEEWVNNEK